MLKLMALYLGRGFVFLYDNLQEIFSLHFLFLIPILRTYQVQNEADSTSVPWNFSRFFEII